MRTKAGYKSPFCTTQKPQKWKVQTSSRDNNQWGRAAPKALMQSVCMLPAYFTIHNKQHQVRAHRVCSSDIIERMKVNMACWIRSCLTEEWQRSFLQLIASCITWANASWAFVMKWHQNKLFCTSAGWDAGSLSIHRRRRERGRGSATWILGAYFGNCFKK